MLSMNVRSLSRSANSRLSRNAPLAAKLPEPAATDFESCQVQAFGPVIVIGPAYGHVADPLAPNSSSPAISAPKQSNSYCRVRFRTKYCAGIEH